MAHETPKTGLNPATRDPERLKQSPITLRPSDETNRRTRKKGAVEAESRRLQRSSSAFLPRKAVGKSPNRARLQLWPLRRKFVRLMKDNPGPQNRALARDEALQQSLPAGIKFGVLDGNAVRFTSLEAWWLVDGAWRPISPDEVLLNAAVMREARFNQFFPEVPRLPSNAFKTDKFQN